MRQPTTPSSQTNRLGVVGLVVSILGVLSFGLLSIFGLTLSLIALRREPRTAATIGTILGAVGLFAFATIFALILGVALPKVALARAKVRDGYELAQLQRIQQAMLEADREVDENGEPVEPGIVDRFTTPGTDELAPEAALRIGISAVDSWARPYRIKASTFDPGVIELSSDGADRIPNTDDDIVSQVDLKTDTAPNADPPPAP